MNVYNGLVRTLITTVGMYLILWAFITAIVAGVTGRKIGYSMRFVAVYLLLPFSAWIGIVIVNFAVNLH